MLNALLALILSFALVCIAAPTVIRLLARRRAGQPILEYVDNHKCKQGTPTMGGLVVILALAVSTLALVRGRSSMTLVALAATAGYGGVGFLDDFIKVRYRRNKGLAAYQKIIAQFGLALLLAYYCYANELIGTELVLPVTGGTVDIGWGIVPFAVLVMLSVTNTVNLTDGLDGLATATTLAYLVPFAGMLAYVTVRLEVAAPVLRDEYANLVLFACALVGALFGFLLFNAYPARVFMGDTGSLALGGALGMLALCTRTSLYVPILGIMFVLSGISVIMQVVWYKLTRRRIFLMSPFHHHLERKGWSEPRIAVLYGAVTLLAACALVLATIRFGGFDYGI